MTTTRKRSAERIEFLGDVLDIAVAHGGHGFFDVLEYKVSEYAIIQDKEDDGGPDDMGPQRIDLDLIAKGLRVIREAKVQLPPESERFGRDEEVLCHGTTGHRLYVGQDLRRTIMLADRTNLEEGDIDVIGALAIVECGLFGKVMFA